MIKIHLPETGRSTVVPADIRPAVGLLLALLIALCATLSIYLQTPPAPLPENAPPQSFSAGRAMKHLRFIAGSPHPLGTAQHDVVRDYIVRELNALGLNPEVQRATHIAPQRSSPYRVGTIENIIGRVPGTDNNQSVLLVAHYDSAPNSFGASDNGSGVAALLETARALKSGAPQKNDVIFLSSQMARNRGCSVQRLL